MNASGTTLGAILVYFFVIFSIFPCVFYSFSVKIVISPRVCSFFVCAISGVFRTACLGVLGQLLGDGPAKPEAQREIDR